jgi:GNAT superfamily N-acetyltransferase
MDLDSDSKARSDAAVWGPSITTRSGFTFRIRSASPSDEAALDDFFHHVTPEDLRYRFLTALDEVSDEQLELMTRIDHRRTENFLAFEINREDIIATAMLAADPRLENAEVAISVRSDYKHRGISWKLLEHVTEFARKRGISRLQSIQSRADYEAIQLEREMGFSVEGYPGDSTLVLLQKELA